MHPLLGFALFPALIALPAAAQTSTVSWSAVWDGPASQDDYPNEITVDAGGNTYVAGRSFDASIGFPPAPPTQDALVAKYDAGGALVWSMRIDWIGGDDLAQDVAVDPVNGDVYVTGYANGYVGTTFVTDLWLARFDASGALIWSVHHDGPGAGPEFGRTLLLDGAGHVYVGASSYGGAATNNDLVLFQFDTLGAFQWEARVDGSGNVADSGGFIALHPSGDLVIAGQLAASTTNGNIGVARVTSAGTIVWQVERDSASGAADFGLGVACDAAGAVYVCGWSTIGDMAPTLVKYSGAGVFQWAIDYPEPAAGTGQFRDVAVDARGFVDVVGHAPSVGTGIDVITVQYDASGVLQWERRADGAAHTDDTSRALAVDGASQVIVGGWSNGPSNTTADADAFVVRYDAAGNERWRHTGIHGALEDRGQDLALRADGVIVYAGFLKPGTRYDVLLVALNEQGVPVCFGDGSSGACPCGNESGAGLGQGCKSSQNRGATLIDTGIASLAADTLVLHGGGMPNATALYIQGQATPQLPAPLLGDGLLCADGTIIRIGAKLNAAGASQYPVAGNASVSVRGQVTFPSTRVYQVWYRNAASYCTPATFNLSNGLFVTWAP